MFETSISVRTRETSHLMVIDGILTRFCACWGGGGGDGPFFFDDDDLWDDSTGWSLSIKISYWLLVSNNSVDFVNLDPNGRETSELDRFRVRIL